MRERSPLDSQPSRFLRLSRIARLLGQWAGSLQCNSTVWQRATEQEPDSPSCHTPWSRLLRLVRDSCSVEAAASGPAIWSPRQNRFGACFRRHHVHVFVACRLGTNRFLVSSHDSDFLHLMASLAELFPFSIPHHDPTTAISPFGSLPLFLIIAQERCTLSEFGALIISLLALPCFDSASSCRIIATISIAQLLCCSGSAPAPLFLDVRFLAILLEPRAGTGFHLHWPAHLPTLRFCSSPWSPVDPHSYASQGGYKGARSFCFPLSLPP